MRVAPLIIGDFSLDFDDSMLSVLDLRFEVGDGLDLMVIHSVLGELVAYEYWREDIMQFKQLLF